MQTVRHRVAMFSPSKRCAVGSADSSAKLRRPRPRRPSSGRNDPVEPLGVLPSRADGSLHLCASGRQWMALLHSKDGNHSDPARCDRPLRGAHPEYGRGLGDRDDLRARAREAADLRVDHDVRLSRLDRRDRGNRLSKCGNLPALLRAAAGMGRPQMGSPDDDDCRGCAAGAGRGGLAAPARS